MSDVPLRRGPDPELPGTGEARPPFPFLVGCGRSGTTLLRAMLDSHPDMAVSHESEWVASMGYRRRLYEAPTGFDAGRFALDLLGHSWASRVGMAQEAVHRAVESSGPGSFTEAVRAVFGAYAAREGKRRAGDKTPAYVVHQDVLAEVLPEGCFVHIIRDGRDVALSYLGVPFGPSNVREAALFWKRRVRIGREAGRRLGPRSYLEVRYEDLVDQPERTLREVSRFLRLAFDDRMLRYYERAEGLVSAARHPEHHAHLFHAPEKGVRDWRSQMGKEDVAQFEALSGDLLGDLGYERSGERASARVRLEAARLRTVEGIRMRRRKARRTLRRMGGRPSTASGHEQDGRMSERETPP